jgi:membrane-bound lytic murein transglycosylase D
MKKYLFISIPVILLIIVIKLFIFSKEKNDGIGDKEYRDAFNKYYKIFAVDIPDEMSFCNEPVPIQRYDVRESFDREILINTYWQSQTLMFFKRANRWFPMVEAILKKNNLPGDLKYISLIESGLMNVKSPAGAAGYWQFMKPTAKSYGLEVNEEIDERFNLEKSTEAACKYFQDAYKIYKNWTLVAASYNSGFGNLNKELQNQKVSSYYDLALNEETGRYIYRILSVKLLLNNPRSYGFYFRHKDLYPVIPSYLVSIDSTVTDLVMFSRHFNISYKLLKDFNPWILGYTLTNKDRKLYKFIIPKVDSLTYDILCKDSAEGIFKMEDSTKTR